MRRTPTLCLAALACLLNSGCVFRDIDNRIAATGASIDHTNAELASLKAEVARVADVLDTRLATLDQTNQHLASMRQDTATLQAIHATLKAIEQHLASYRRTIENVDDAIPLLPDVADPAPPRTPPS